MANLMKTLDETQRERLRNMAGSVGLGMADVAAWADKRITDLERERNLAQQRLAEAVRLHNERMEYAEQLAEAGREVVAAWDARYPEGNTVRDQAALEALRTALNESAAGRASKDGTAVGRVEGAKIGPDMNPSLSSADSGDCHSQFTDFDRIKEYADYHGTDGWNELARRLEIIYEIANLGDGKNYVFSDDAFKLFITPKVENQTPTTLTGATAEVAPAPHDSQRLAWLHSHNRDADGWEYGVARVKFNEHGQVVAGPEWTRSDHSDIDALMGASHGVRNEEAKS